ncbi:hypothetical protein [Methylobacterium sp. J-067]|uniref:hypothetical protein n=1 Tax=Methylobacterium sp. J-067 TaxID=2836648 RepID=UPI001FB9A90B|nr:hypothetical protein [Methylobacterium sp. J-067]MCJ2023388.1 hypothetical protein [Methylobacterium sp. J-067]
MTLFNRNEMDAGAAMARRALGKPEPTGDRPKTQDERIREWGERCRTEQSETKARAAIPNAIRTRVLSSEEVRHVGRPGTSYAIGDTRPAMDGTRWKRVG